MSKQKLTSLKNPLVESGLRCGRFRSITRHLAFTLHIQTMKQPTHSHYASDLSFLVETRARLGWTGDCLSGSFLEGRKYFGLNLLLEGRSSRSLSWQTQDKKKRKENKKTCFFGL